MKLLNCDARSTTGLTVALLVGAMCGCVQTPYRYEIHDTGEGSIQVETVPKSSPATPAPTAPPAPVAAVAPAATPPTDQQRIDQLQAQVKALSAENQKLKQAATTAPAKD